MKYLLPLILLSACSTVSQPLNQNVFYRRDMGITVNGVQAQGVMVAAKAPSYVIEGASKGRLDMVILTSCHREWTAENQGDHFKYTYTPSAGIEDSLCTVKLVGLDRKHGKHTWGFLDFQDASSTLPATMKCNGDTYAALGVSACQSATGLLQEIDFPSEVLAVPDTASGCTLDGPLKGKTFRFTMKPHECVYEFEETAEPHRLHRMNTLGYDQVILMEN